MSSSPEPQAESHGVPFVRTIGPEARLGLPRPSELWRFRDLAYFLVRRDVAVRYKQTVIGVLWAVLQPLGLAIVFSLFLGSLANVPAGNDVPYPLYAFSGLALWVLFTAGLQNASVSTIASEQLITKAYFPRVLLPLAATIPALIDFLVALVVVLAAMVAYGYPPGLSLLVIPVPVALTFVLTAGAGLLLSATAVRYRDVQLVVPFVVLVGLFVTPVMYPFSLVPDNLQPIYALNPMVGLLELYRWCLFGSFSGDVWILAISLVACVAVTVGGFVYFTRAERTFADVI